MAEGQGGNRPILSAIVFRAD